MAIQTYTEQLEEVQATIAVIHAGGVSSVSINGRTVTYTDRNLQALYDREKYLRKMADRETRGGIRVRGVTPVSSR